MNRGTVKWFNAQKGYGFITCEDDSEVFVHYSAINADGYKVVTEGQEVEFEVVTVEKGMQAVNVTVIQ